MSDANQDPLHFDVVSSFLSQSKVISGDCLWRRKNHADYREVGKIVECAEMPELNAELRLTAHVTRIPQKYGFALLIGSTRILALDVNPAASHYNPKSLESVTSTHWQRYPDMDAEADPRSLSHFEWLAEFCKHTNIENRMIYKAPPFNPPQLDLI